MRASLSADRVALARVTGRLGDPRLAIASHQQSLDDRLSRLGVVARSLVVRRREALSRAQRRLAYLHPRAVIARERAELSRTTDRLASVWSSSFERRATDLQRATARLDALSPLKVLARGYAIATREDGRAVRAASDVGPGDRVHVRVRDARLEARVLSVEPLDGSHDPEPE
jgi:exodeoxyribonuclease VII large subunit